MSDQDVTNQMIFYPGALEKHGEEWIQVGNRCQDCGKTSYPAMELCIFCSSDQVEKAPLSKVGTVFSYTVTRVPVGPYKPPIICAHVDLPEGTRVFGQIHADESKVKAGMQVIMEAGVLYQEKDGADVYGFYYVPYESEQGGA